MWVTLKDHRLRIQRLMTLILCMFVATLSLPSLAQEKYQASTTLQAPAPKSRGYFGKKVDFSGEVVVVGEIGATVEGKSFAGEVHVFDSGGKLLTTLQSPEPQVNTAFGYSVAVDRDIVVVGEQGRIEEGVSDVGRAYIFTTDGNLLASFLSPSPDANSYFGGSVAVSGDIVIVGEQHHKVEDILEAGLAHVFDSEGNLVFTLESPEPTISANFGRSVDVSEDIIVVGEVTAIDNDIIGPGSAYLFDKDGNLLTTFKSPDPDSKNFGGHVAINGDLVVLSDSYADVEGKSRAGKVYAFDTDGNLILTLQSPAPGEMAEFGCSVAVSGDTIVVGEFKADANAINVGKVYIFDADGNLLKTLQAPIPQINAHFGWSVAINGDVVVVGECYATIEGENKAGRAHIFGGTRKATPESEQETAPTATEAEQESKPSFTERIPGFQSESIILGLTVGVVALWLIQRL